MIYVVQIFFCKNIFEYFQFILEVHAAGRLIQKDDIFIHRSQKATSQSQTLFFATAKVDPLFDNGRLQALG